MKFTNSIRFKFRALSIGVFLIITIFLSTFMLMETLKITKTISRGYAELYSSEIVGDINTHLQREIALALKASKTNAVIEWMKDENNIILKQQAYNEITQFNQLFENKNLFIAPNKLKNIYFTDATTSFEKMMPSGTLSSENQADIWYFKTMQTNQDYLLNIDSDRFLNTLRSWINVKVVSDGKVQGVIGTGLYLDPFIKDIFERRKNTGAKSLIINEFGAIQMDSDISNIRENSFAADEKLEKTIFAFYNSQNFSVQVKAYLAQPENPVLLDLEDGKYQYAALSPVKGTNWHVITFFDANSLFSLSSFESIGLMLLLILIVLMSVLSFIVHRIFMKPFEALNESIETKGSVVDGKIFGLDRADEFGLLANTIQQMKDRLDFYNKDLETEVAHSSQELDIAYHRIISNEKRLNKLFETLPVGIFILDSHHNFNYLNPYCLNQFGYSSEKLFKNTFYENPKTFFVNPLDYDRLMSTLSGKPETANFQLQMKNLEGKFFWIEMILIQMSNNSESIGYEGILINIQDKKDFEQKLMDLAMVDRLTGLYNRHYFDQVAIEEKNRSDRYGDAISFVMLDLDHFKNVNDTWGHNVGDQVLALTAKVLSQSIRKSDILTRWGGEEFAILMPNTTQNGAQVVSEKIRRAIEKTNHPTAGMVTASFGVAERHKGENIEDLFKRADQALFKAKEQGRNRVVGSEDLVSRPGAFVKLVWKSGFESGNNLIDSQHKTLFELANGFMELMLSPDSLALEKIQFEQMLLHIVEHFKDEEQLMLNAGYPEFLEHKEKHKILVDEALALKQQFDEEKFNTTAIFTFLIEEVILEHLLKEDIKMFPYVKA
jgi:diguanylate cyclase (GGDEF)-like protein/hemerythrin-like metal-binding protein/PAS domain S-box-containing protein